MFWPKNSPHDYQDCHFGSSWVLYVVHRYSPFPFSLPPHFSSKSPQHCLPILSYWPISKFPPASSITFSYSHWFLSWFFTFISPQHRCLSLCKIFGLVKDCCMWILICLSIIAGSETATTIACSSTSARKFSCYCQIFRYKVEVVELWELVQIFYSIISMMFSKHFSISINLLLI